MINHMTERKRRQNLAKPLQRFFAKLNESMKLSKVARKGTSDKMFLKKPSNGSTGTVFMFLKNCCIHRPKRIEAVRFLHCSCES